MHAFIIPIFWKRKQTRVMICWRNQDSAFLIKPHVLSAIAQHPQSFPHPLGPELQDTQEEAEKVVCHRVSVQHL